MRVGLRCALVKGTVIWGAMLATASGHTRADDNLSSAKVAALGAEANLGALRTFKCRFTVTKATSPNPQEALKQNFTNVRKCEYLLVVDGDRKKLESLTPIDTTPPKNLREGINPLTGEKGKYRSLDFAPIGDLRKGDKILRYASEWNQAQIFEDPGKSEDDGPTPLTEIGWRGSNGLSAWREAADNGRGRATSRGAISEAGRSLMHLQYELDTRTKSIVFDPNEGYLPRRIRHLDKKSADGEPISDFQIHLIEAKNVGHGRWFPMHVIEFANPAVPTSTISVADIQVTELVLDKVTEDDLSLDIAAGTGIYRRDMPVGAGERIRLRKNERVSPDDIARIEKMLKDAPSHPLMDTAIHQPGSRWYKRWYFLTGAAVALVGALVLYRYRRPKAS